MTPIDAMVAGIDLALEGRKPEKCCSNPRGYWHCTTLRDGSPIDLKVCKSCSALLAVEWADFDAA